MVVEKIDSPEVRERYFTVQQVAERLQVNVQTVRRWLRDGDLQGVRLAGQWRITDNDLREFVEKRRGESG